MLVSIIMPVYNSEKYLKEAIQSVIDQTYSKIELIIINDGSIDNSKTIIEEYCKNDARIILKNIQNSGVSSARNLGLSIAKGDFILFVDSDDIINKNFVKDMLEVSNDYDLVICGYSKKFIKHSDDIILHSKINNNEELLINIASNNLIGGFVWNKMFKAKIIKQNNIKFRKNIYVCEDMIFVFEYLSKIKSFIYIPKPLYLYRMRKSSATMQKNYDKSITELKAYEEVMKINLSTQMLIFMKYRYIKSYYKLKIILI